MKRQLDRVVPAKGRPAAGLRSSRGREALRQAGQVRLRPILMTTATTVLGLFPMAVGQGEGSELRAAASRTA